MEFSALENASNWGNNPAGPNDQVQRNQQYTVDDAGDGDAPGPGLPCPFYIKDRNIWRKCIKHCFRNTADIRQHIERTHMQEYCLKCGATFDNDGFDKLLKAHVKAGECHVVLFCPPGVTSKKFEHLKRLGCKAKHEHVSMRWELIWLVIFGHKPPPNSLYASGETVFVQRLLDICNIINDGEWQRLAPATPWADIGEYDLYFFNRLINTARQLERLPHGITSPPNSRRTMPETHAPETGSGGTPLFPAAAPSPIEVSVPLPLLEDSTQPAADQGPLHPTAPWEPFPFNAQEMLPFDAHEVFPFNTHEMFPFNAQEVLPFDAWNPEDPFSEATLG